MTLDKDKIVERQKDNVIEDTIRTLIEAHEHFTTNNFFVYYVIRLLLKTSDYVWLANNYPDKNSGIYRQMCRYLIKFNVVNKPEEQKDWVLETLQTISNEMKKIKEELAKEKNNNATQ